MAPAICQRHHETSRDNTTNRSVVLAIAQAASVISPSRPGLQDVADTKTLSASSGPSTIASIRRHSTHAIAIRAGRHRDRDAVLFKRIQYADVVTLEVE